MLECVIPNFPLCVGLHIGALGGIFEAQFVSILPSKGSCFRCFLFNSPFYDNVKVTAILRGGPFFLSPCIMYTFSAVRHRGMFFQPQFANVSLDHFVHCDLSPQANPRNTPPGV